MLGSLPPLLVLPILELLAAVPTYAAPAHWQLSPRQGGAAAYPVSVARAAAGRGYGFTHAFDELYSGTVFVNGVPYQMILDTGSSDSWIDPASVGGEVPPGLVHTGFNSTQKYLDGSGYTGQIVLADVDFGPYTVRNQAITLAYNAAAATSTASNSGLYNGILGLGGPGASDIVETLAGTQWQPNGIPITYNIFSHFPDQPAYSTWLPSRSDIGLEDGGVLTFSEVLANMTDVLDAPRIPSVHNGTWTVRMDGMYVNGRFLSGGSRAAAQYEGASAARRRDDRLVASLDTGSSYIHGLKEYVNAVYRDVPGAFPEVDPDGDVLWHVPCDAKVNVSLSFEGLLYPIHPIDLTKVSVEGGALICYGTLIGSKLSVQDFLLGDTFLRNVYTLYGYPDAHDPNEAAYIQMRSIVDPAQAWVEADTLLPARLLAFEDAYISGVEDEPESGADIDVDDETEGSPVARPSYTGAPQRPSVTALPVRPALVADVDATLASTNSASEADEEREEESSRRAVWVSAGFLASAVVLLLILFGVSALKRKRNAEEAREEGTAEEAMELLESPVSDDAEGDQRRGG